MTDIELRSLAPEYDDDHHKAYVSRLNEAVSDTRNKNIALTGRYGVGKSSILDEFIKYQENPGATAPETQAPDGGSTEDRAEKQKKEKHKKAAPKKVLRISINTLGPDEGEDLTNRIQKELVKQLVYRAKPGEVRSSAFARAPELTLCRAGLEALVVTTALVGLLWLFGLRPDEDALGTDGLFWPTAAFFALVFVILWAVRWYIGTRVVAQVSAGGASIALEGKGDSYFDKYLDELIAFFEATDPDIVVFEDLDRFDDPQIFDSLRELNTLVNTSAHWRNRRERPLRFIYAIKDSLFEKLGDEQEEKDAAGKPGDVQKDGPAATPPKKDLKKRDTAAEALERANRTKFFELVIPVVPFLSHSNARDHFLKELGKLNLPEETTIDRGVIDIVARHTTDMRLMINISNEFVVYAEQLLWVDGTKKKRAPGLTADRLFALVVYKNFHLADFEALPHRDSALDRLETARRNLVTTAIKNLQTQRATLSSGETRQSAQQALASILGGRLTVLLAAGHMSLQAVSADSISLDVAATDEPAFWQALARAKEARAVLTSSSVYVSDSSLDRKQLASLFPELDDLLIWTDAITPVDNKRLSEIDVEIADLRGADFKSLIEDGRYEYNAKTFDGLAKDTLPSQLALDLVSSGHIDRFYAEYATVFYGEFLGVDVANFFRNNVWPNEMNILFSFTTPGAVENVLAQAPSDFLRTRSALNVDVVNHLMSLPADASTDLIDFLSRPKNEDARQFLRTYFNTPKSATAVVVARLAGKPWPELFSFIAAEGSAESEGQTVLLLNAALLGARGFEDFELDDAARSLISRLHEAIPAFREAQAGGDVNVLFEFLSDALPRVPSLRTLSPELQQLVINTKRYELTADNLRVAASLTTDEAISADNLIGTGAVWEYCVDNLDFYLELVESDQHTTSSCTSSMILADVINAQHEDWTSEQIKAFLATSAESAALPKISSIPQDAWRAVVSQSRAVPNFTNLAAYTAEIGVDDAVAALFTDETGGVIDVIDAKGADDASLAPLIPLLLNAGDVLTPKQRVLLAQQLMDATDWTGISLSEVTASPDDLFAEMLQAGLVADDAATFDHFLTAGWTSIGPALQVSKNAATFITPALVQGHAGEVVRGTRFPAPARRAVLERLSEFAATEDSAFLASAASAARASRVRLSAEALALVAPAVKVHEDVVWQLNDHGDAIDPPTTLRILGRMTGGFSGFAEPSGHAFKVVDTTSMRSVVGRLKRAGVIKLQLGGQPKGWWKLRVA